MHTLNYNVTETFVAEDQAWRAKQEARLSLSTWNVAQLKEILKKHIVTATGHKGELITRILDCKLYP